MMTLLASAFQRERQSAALIPFITAGFPYADSTVPILTAMAADADIIEVGVPFSDPMADGPAIQRANQRALANHTTLAVVLAQVAEFRETNQQTPVVLMGYANSFINYGLEAFADAAANAGVNGVIIVDLSDHERPRWRAALAAQEIDLVGLIAPTTSPSRQQWIAEQAGSFLYVIALRGITGAHHLQADAIGATLGEIRRHTALPLAVGFGIRTAEQAAAVAQQADGIVIGSRIVEIAEAQPDEAAAAVASYLKEIRGALRQSQ